MIKVPLSPRQWAALVPFTCNVGVGGFKGSTLRRVINEGGDYGTAQGGKVRDAFMMWLEHQSFAAGRREKEVTLLLTPPSS